MRLWSIHPHYLDAQGLVAVWREALLAKAVLDGKTKGYRNHPQLTRFKNADNPCNAINTYLFFLWKEATRRKYNFDRSKIDRLHKHEKILISKGQLRYELAHLTKKLQARSPEKAQELEDVEEIEPHPLFRAVEGGIASWERLKC